MSRPVVVAMLLVGLVVNGCTGSEEPTSEQASTAPPSLGALDTTSLRVPREGFCDAIGDAAVTRALGTAAQRSSSWDPGDEITPSPGVRETGDELGCAYATPGAARAQAWVFAPPIATARARGLVDGLGAAPGCRAVSQAAAFGQPSVARMCRGQGSESGTRRASFHGLFGDAWLSCELTVPDGTGRQELLRRTEQWCADVLTAARA